MSAASKHLLFALSSLLFATGCLHTHLRNNTIAQMETVHDLQQQQVLDNLAMFVNDIHAYPYFSLVAGGTSQLTDTGSISITNSWSRASGAFLYSALGINPSMTCAAQGVWQITPINDSVKLTVMRCLYQRAVSGCCHAPLPSDCPNCEKVFNIYYPWENQQPMAAESQSSAAGPTLAPTAEAQKKSDDTEVIPLPTGNPALDLAPNKSEPKSSKKPDKEGKEKAAASDDKKVKYPQYPGLITPSCIPTDRCWFGWGCKSDVPKDCSCLLVGHYCDTYVWVPAEGRDELSKLTILVLDIAYYDPALEVGPNGQKGLRSSGGPTYFRAPTQQLSPLLFNSQLQQAFGPQLVPVTPPTP